MNGHVVKGLCTAVFVVFAQSPAVAQQDKNAERAQRRAQLQMQALQQQLDEAQAARTKAEAERAELQKRQQSGEAALTRASSAERRLSTEAKTLRAERDALAARVSELEQQMAAQKSAADTALATREREARAAIARRDEEQSALQARFVDQVRLVTQCSEKNERLARLGLELIERYRNKGFVDVARQREPVLGLNEVQTFNLLQEYRDRADAERFTPSANRP